nr:MAG TPA: ATP synthase subunit alpha [Caudoviricetes sp.]
MGRTDHQNADIGAVEEKARKAGLSYGQYMAIQRIIEMESRK